MVGASLGDSLPVVTFVVVVVAFAVVVVAFAVVVVAFVVVFAALAAAYVNKAWYVTLEQIVASRDSTALWSKVHSMLIPGII